jgi:peptidoglycan/LPS O-acetylase OafA/YrhL
MLSDYMAEFRDNNFDFMRLLLAVLVIYSHSFVLGRGSHSQDFLSKLSSNQMSGGDLAVDGFFIISGFLVTSSFMRSSSMWSYLRKRILRVYPGFVCVSLLTICIVMPLSSGHLVGTHRLGPLLFALWKIISLSDLKCIGAFSSNPFPGVINGSLWTIRFEFLCYIGLAVLGACGLLRRRRICLLLFLCSLAISLGIAFSALTQCQHGQSCAEMINNWMFLTRLLPAYFAGVVGYLYRDKLVITTWRTLSAFAFVTFALYIPRGVLIAIPIFGAYLLFAFAYSRTIRLNHFGRYGDFSYGTYLYAFPIQQLVMLRFGYLNWMFLCLISIPVTIVVAAASWHLVEKRFLPKSRVLI